MSRETSQDVIYYLTLFLGIVFSTFLHEVTGLRWSLTEVLIFTGIVSLASAKIIFRDFSRKFDTLDEALEHKPIWMDIYEMLAAILFFAMLASLFYTLILPA
jgi:hypothetical protein